MCVGTCGWCVYISKKLLMFSIKLFDNKNLFESSKCNPSLYIVSNYVIIVNKQNIMCFTDISYKLIYLI